MSEIPDIHTCNLQMGGFISYSHMAAHNKDRVDGTSAVNDTNYSISTGTATTASTASSASSAAVHLEDTTQHKWH